MIAACIRGRSSCLSLPNLPLTLHPKTLSQEPVVSNNIFTIWFPRRAKSGHYYIFCVCMRQSAHCTAAGLNSVAAFGKSEQRLGEQGRIQTCLSLPGYLKQLLCRPRNETHPQSCVLENWSSRNKRWRLAEASRLFSGVFSPLSFVFRQDLFESDHRSSPLEEQS